MDRSVLNKATSTDDTPTPGYLYTEIAQATFSDPMVSQQLADYLVNKLSKDNPHVKFKCLRIIREVSVHGKADFRRILQKKNDLIKSCMAFRGTPDPLRGDVPNQMVREEAGHALKAIFSSDITTNAYGVSTQESYGRRKMEGMGNSNFDPEFRPEDSAYGRKKMEGIGNPNFDHQFRPEEPGAVKQLAEKAALATFSMVSRVPGMSAVADKLGIGSASDFHHAPCDAPYRPPISRDVIPDHYVKPPSTHTSMQAEYEARLVGEICASGGPRVAPSSAALEEFCRKCESLDSTAIADQLRSKLARPDWQTRLKALHVVEALHNAGFDAITGHISQFSSDLLFECQGVPQCRSKASKVLCLLGFTDQPDDVPQPRMPEPQKHQPACLTPSPPPAAVFDLLDLEGPGQQPSAVPEPASIGREPDLFDNLIMAPGADGGVELADSPPPAAAASISAASLLGNLDLLQPATATPQHQAAAPPPLGRLGGMYSAPAPSASGLGCSGSTSVGLVGSATGMMPNAMCGGGPWGMNCAGMGMGMGMGPDPGFGAGGPGCSGGTSVGYVSSGMGMMPNAMCGGGPWGMNCAGMGMGMGPGPGFGGGGPGAC